MVTQVTKTTPSIYMICEIKDCNNKVFIRRRRMSDGIQKEYTYDRCLKHLWPKVYKNRADRRKKYSKKYSKKYREKNYNNGRFVYRQKKYAAKRKGILFSINKEWFCKWWVDNSDTCYYCGMAANAGERLQIDRYCNRDGYIEGNIVAACKKCNKYKSDLFDGDEWYALVNKYNLLKRYKYND